jgi:hypothetical protein
MHKYFYGGLKEAAAVGVGKGHGLLVLRSLCALHT